MPRRSTCALTPSWGSCYYASEQANFACVCLQVCVMRWQLCLLELLLLLRPLHSTPSVCEALVLLPFRPAWKLKSRWCAGMSASSVKPFKQPWLTPAPASCLNSQFQLFWCLKAPKNPAGCSDQLLCMRWSGMCMSTYRMSRRPQSHCRQDR